MGESKAGRTRAVRRVLWRVLFMNLAVAGAKLFLGWQVGAISLVADGLHSVLDGSSNIVGLIGIALAARPPDAEHPYGHRRFETIAAVIIGLLIGAGFVEILREVVRGLLGQRPAPEASWLATGVVAATVFVNVAISRYEARRAKELGSSLLAADAQHTATDALAAVAVLVGFGAIAMGYVWADLLIATLVSVLIAIVAWRILRQNVGALADKAQLDPTQVVRVARSHPGVLGANCVRSRGTPDYVQLDLHVQLDPTLSLRKAHAMTHEVADVLQRAFPQLADVVIHTEPADSADFDAESDRRTPP